MTMLMTEMEKMKAGLEYSFVDKELIARKSLAIVRCQEYNAINCPALKHGRRRCWRRYATLTKANRKDIN